MATAILKRGKYNTSLHMPCGTLQMEDALQCLHITDEKSIDGLRFEAIAEFSDLELDNPTLDEWE